MAQHLLAPRTKMLPDRDVYNWYNGPVPKQHTSTAKYTLADITTFHKIQKT